MPHSGEGSISEVSMKSLRQTVKLLCIALLTLAAPVGADAQAVPQSQTEITLSFAPLVKKTAPSVVNIYVKQLVKGTNSPFSGDPFFEQFFKDFGTQTQHVENSLGSGVILSESGLVVSNYHVVGEATEISVVLADRREFAAKVILADQQSDLAVLRLQGVTDLPYLPLRASDSIEVGELVLAIGNPFGVGQTVSSGIVSGLARSSISLGRGYFIQTDAPVNPGNSGGALIDMAGNLIGINSAIITSSGGSNGVGFAIPADLVAQFLAQAEAGGREFTRPWAGVWGQAVDTQMAQAFGLDRPKGMVLTELHPLGPFGMADFKPGDVVLAMDGAEVNSPQEIMFRLAVAGIGAKLRVQYFRDGKQAEAMVVLAPALDTPDRAAVTISEGGLAGLSVANINPAVIAEMALPLTAQGVVIAGLEGALSRSGMAPGDILTSINEEAINSTADVERLARQSGRRWTVDALRNGQRVRVSFRL
jgi:Do/DeqQ family serine protease